MFHLYRRLLQVGRQRMAEKKVGEEWRIRSNSKIIGILENKDIVWFIKSQRIQWFGHDQRMESTGLQH